LIKANVKTQLSLGNISLDVTKELERIAEREIIPDIHKRIDSGIDIDGKAYRSLSPITIKIKRSRGHRLDPLIATGQLRRSIYFKRIGTNRVLISFKPQRKPYKNEESISNQDLAYILQVEGVPTKYGKRYFKFFGISDEAERRAFALMVKLIRKRINNARSRTIR
jgi:hypothetical protein